MTSAASPYWRFLVKAFSACEGGNKGEAAGNNKPNKSRPVMDGGCSTRLKRD